MWVVDGLFGSGMGAYARHFDHLVNCRIWRPWTNLPTTNPTPADVGVADDPMLMHLAVAELLSMSGAMASKNEIILGCPLSMHAVRGTPESLRCWRLWLWWMSRQRMRLKLIVVDTPPARINNHLVGAGLPVPPDLVARVNRLRNQADQAGLINVQRVRAWDHFVPEEDIQWT